MSTKFLLILSNIDLGFVNWIVQNTYFFSSMRMRLKTIERKSNDNIANAPAKTDKSIVFDKFIRDANLSIFSEGSQFEIKRQAEIYEKPNASNIEIISRTGGDCRNLEKTLLIYTERENVAIKQTTEMTHHSLAV